MSNKQGSTVVLFLLFFIPVMYCQLCDYNSYCIVLYFIIKTNAYDHTFSNTTPIMTHPSDLCADRMMSCIMGGTCFQIWRATSYP